jgi:hypothetical protein
MEFAAAGDPRELASKFGKVKIINEETGKEEYFVWNIETGSWDSYLDE